MAISVSIDGIALDRWIEVTSHHWLNKTYVATVRLPVASAGSPKVGKLLKIVDTALPFNTIDFHGRIKFMSASDGEDGDGTVEYTAYSAREIWEWRPARNGPATSDPGNYIKPTFFQELLYGPAIMEDVLTQSLDGSDPALGEGPGGFTLGTFASGGLDLSGAPMNTPMTIEQLATLLTSTGEVDIVETMIDSGGNWSEISVYHGNYTSGGSGSFTFGPGGNVRSIEWNQNMDKLANKIRYLLGPRISDTRWRRSIEASNVDIPDTSTYTQAELVSAIMASRDTYHVRADIRIFDQFGLEADAVPFYWRLWQDESLWRLQPRNLVTIVPREGLYPTFDIGDLITVSAWSGFMGGFSGTMRVFGRKLRWDADGVCSIVEINASDNADYLS